MKKIMFVIIAAFLFIEVASAIEIGCCERTTEGAWCMDAPAECDTEYRTSSNICDTPGGFCELGYCYDPSSGYCSPQSPKERCEQGGGEWSQEENQNLCQKGCCNLERNTGFMTRRTCEIRSALYGLEMIFDLTIPEEDCRYLSSEMGACEHGENLCDYTTEILCVNSHDGNFHRNTYCSQINDNYEGNHHAGCVEGEKDVYWFDSEDNRERIKERCVEFEERCDESSGEAICKNLSCVDENGGSRKNGEEWCVYDAYVGNSKDVVGSEHYKYSCVEGEIDVEASNYRSKICAEKISEGSTTSSAQLRSNLGFMCSSIEDQEECENIRDCRYLSINIASQFYFDVCVPKYPEGFDFYSPNENENGEGICKYSSLDCTMIYEKQFPSFSWECVENCGCKTPLFINKMNEFCTSLGDCGTHINYGGRLTNNVETNWEYYHREGNVITDDYAQYLNRPNAVNNTPVFLILDNRERGYINYDIDTSVEYDQERLSEILFDFAEDNWWNPLGLDALIVDINVWIWEKILDLFHIGNTREIIISFECNPWEPPIGGADCSKCNEDPLKKCTDYRCESLGKSCGILPDTRNTENPLCSDMYECENEFTTPEITFRGIEGENYQASESNIPQTDITLAKISPPIEEFSFINFSITTSEDAVCYWDLERQIKIIDMRRNFNFRENLAYGTIHYSEEFRLPSADEGSERIYIMCSDPCENIKEYALEFDIKPQPDNTAPVILRFNPESGSYLRIDETTKLVNVYLNEPGVCKHSLSPNQDYEIMNPTLCDERAYICTGAIQNLTQEENKIYFKCNDSFGNINLNDREYTLIRTPQELRIDSISPQGTILEDDFELQVITSGGMANGDSICRWKVLERVGWWDYFEDIPSTTHTYEFEDFPQGGYEFEIFCQDKILNNITQAINLNVEVDTTPPIVVRAHRDEVTSKLKIITNELAECAYDTHDCHFNFENGTDMTTALSTNHFADWVEGRTYYIKCKDQWENTNPGCAIIISPGF